MSPHSFLLSARLRCSYLVSYQHHCSGTNKYTSMNKQNLPKIKGIEKQCCSFFTNADQVKKDDPYAVLGLSWGDGSTTKEIQMAYRQRASQLHPDVNTTDSPTVAAKKFQHLQQAYQKLMKIHSNLPGLDSEKDNDWRFSIWRNSDRIAIDRTDVAGIKRKRPIIPALQKATYQGATLGHPSGRGGGGGGFNRGEYLESNTTTSTANDSTKLPPSSVGRGWNKWVTRPPMETFVPWNKNEKNKSS